MTTEKKQTGKERKPRSIEEAIAEQRDKLKKLEDKQREQIRKEREKTAKAVLELIRAEKLDLIDIEKWNAALPTVKEALGLK
jgi:Spy/CpxP family protein refolding chaperone